MLMKTILIACISLVSVKSKPLKERTDILEDIADSLRKLTNDLSGAAEMKSTLSSLSNELQKLSAETDGKLEELDKKIKNTNNEQMMNYVDQKNSALNETLSELANSIEEIRELAVKKDVVFHVKNIAVQPTVGGPILFTTTVIDTDEAYNMSTGCFTAPRAGTYWFAAQICTHGHKRFSPSIYKNSQLVSRIQLQDYYSDNSALMSVVMLQPNDTVCLRAGPHQFSSGAVRESSENSNINAFMGSLVN